MQQTGGSLFLLAPIFQEYKMSHGQFLSVKKKYNEKKMIIFIGD